MQIVMQHWGELDVYSDANIRWLADEFLDQESQRIYIKGVLDFVCYKLIFESVLTGFRDFYIAGENYFQKEKVFADLENESFVKMPDSYVLSVFKQGGTDLITCFCNNIVFAWIDCSKISAHTEQVLLGWQIRNGPVHWGGRIMEAIKFTAAHQMELQKLARMVELELTRREVLR